MDKPASDPLAYVTGKDQENFAEMSREERREIQAAEGAIAMADYKRARQATLDRMFQLRAERLKRARTGGHGGGQ